MDAQQAEAMRPALERLVGRAGSPELEAALGSVAVEELRRGAERSLAFAAVRDAAAAEAAGAVAGCCVCFASEAEDLTEPILLAVRDSLAAVAGLLPPCQEAAQPAGDAAVECSARALDVLEAFSDSLDYLVAQLFSGLFRSLAGPTIGEGLGEPAIFAARLDVLRSVAVWAITVLVRAVGRERFDGRCLWDWTDGEPFAIFVVARGLLAEDGPAPGTAAEAGEGEAPWPRDWAALREVVWGALLELPSPDIVFQTDARTQALEDADIAERQEALWLHRALLAVAAADCSLLEALLPHAERALDRGTWGSGRACARPLAAAAFLAALVQPPLESLPSGLHEFTDALVRQLASHAGRLWRLLSHALEVPLGVEPGDKRRVQLRGFLRDCSALAFAAPPSEADSRDFLRMALSEQSSEVSKEVRDDPKALAALVVFAANACLVPAGDHLADTLAGLPAAARSEASSRAGKWRGLARLVELSPWLDLLGSAGDGPGVAAEDDEDDDFFEATRREVRAARASAACASC